MDSLVETAFSLILHFSVKLFSDETISDLEYATEVVLLSDDPGSLWHLLWSFDKSSMLVRRFSPPKCKIMLQDWIGAAPNLSIRGQFIELIVKFICLGSCITPDGSIVSLRIQKVWPAFSNLHHLWRRNDIKLSTKGRGHSFEVTLNFLQDVLNPKSCSFF